MNELHEEDVLADVRIRIIDALLLAQARMRQRRKEKWKQLLCGANIELVDIMGSRLFSVLQQDEYGMLNW